MPGENHREAAKRLVNAARKHREAEQSGQDTQATTDELKQALDAAKAPLEEGSKEFLQAAKQEIDAAPSPLELRAKISPAPTAGGETKTNWAGDVVIHPKSIATPKSLEELCATVREATANKQRVRAFGYGHSYSDILDTTGVLVDLSQLVTVDRPPGGVPPSGGLLPRGDELWKDPRPDEARVRIECGARIAEVNQALNKAGLAFGNLGGHVGQTVIGAMATSTHGTGWNLPPLCDIALSFDLVTSGGHLVRIEPDDGITDPMKFIAKYSTSRSLIQNTDVFRAAKVSLGCLGIVYALTVKVEGAYLLSETRTMTKWSQLAPKLVANLDQVAGGCRHYNLLINPYSAGGDPDCVEIVRNKALPGTPIAGRPFKADFSVWAAAEFLDDFTVWIINMAGAHAIESLVGSALKSQLFAPVCDWSFRVFDNGYSTNIKPDRDGVSTRIKAISNDLIFPAEKTVAAIDALLELIKRNEKNKWLQSSPLSVRFASQSDAWLSPFNEGRMVSIECPQLKGIWNLEDTLHSYEEELCHGPKGDDLRGRPSWGQKQALTSDPKWLRDRYKGFDNFVKVFKELNEGGVFDNAFTDRLGISVGGAT